MSSRHPHEHRALEAFFQAARELESSVMAERSKIVHLENELKSQSARHAQELEQAKKYAQALLARDEELRRHLTAAQAKIQSIAAHATQLQDGNARLSAEARENKQKIRLDLNAAHTAVEQMRRRALEHEDTIAKLKLELERGRQETERLQGEILEREHRYQSSLLSYKGREHHYQASVVGYQGRDQAQQAEIQSLRDQLGRAQQEIARSKARQLEIEKLRLDANKMREEAEIATRRNLPAIERLRELEEANRSLTERLAIEKRQRKEADGGIEMTSREKEALQSALRSAEERLAFTEAQLAKSSSEAALLKATRRSAKEQPAFTPLDSRAPLNSMELEMLERLALPGYPVRN